MKWLQTHILNLSKLEFIFSFGNSAFMRLKRSSHIEVTQAIHWPLKEKNQTRNFLIQFENTIFL